MSSFSPWASVSCSFKAGGHSNQNYIRKLYSFSPRKTFPSASKAHLQPLPFLNSSFQVNIIKDTSNWRGLSSSSAFKYSLRTAYILILNRVLGWVGVFPSLVTKKSLFLRFGHANVTVWGQQAAFELVLHLLTRSTTKKGQTRRDQARPSWGSLRAEANQSTWQVHAISGFNAQENTRNRVLCHNTPNFASSPPTDDTQDFIPLPGGFSATSAQDF